MAARPGRDATRPAGADLLTLTLTLTLTLVGRQALTSERKRRRMAQQMGLGDSLGSVSLRPGGGENLNNSLSESMPSITELGFSLNSLSDTKNTITELSASNLSNAAALHQLGVSH